jgi:L-2,4-diaminobutyrate decarboxylase
MSDPATSAFDPESFRVQGHALVDRLATYLARAQAGEARPVLPWRDPGEMADAWPSQFLERGQSDPEGLLEHVIAEAIHLHDPHYVGHQVTSPLPLAALCELAGTLLNNAMAVYEMGPGATAMERSLVRWMAGCLGWDARADGVLTSGGSVGNLTALLAARQARAGYDAWNEGAYAGLPLCVLASEQAHYCVGRAAQIMGWGRDGVVPVPVDEHFRMRASALPETYRGALRAGRKPIAVVGSACSTATGAFDPLDEIADFCASRGLWFHVDGAHGASAVLTDRYRRLLDGIERADSVVWDAHKMLLMPALVTAVLFRDGRRSYEAFAQEASYLFQDGDPRAGWYDTGVRTLECTKRMLSLPLYTALTVYGTRLFAEYVAGTFDLARRFAGLLRAAPDFELAVEPECNIVCFRHVPAGARDLDALQAALRRRLLRAGGFYLVQVRLPAGLYLRTTLINPLTREEDLVELLETLRAAARE